MKTSGMVKKLSILLAAALLYTALPSYSQQNNYESRKQLAWLIKGAEPTTQDCRTIDSIITNPSEENATENISKAIKKIREGKTEKNEELLPADDETKLYLSLRFYTKSLAEEYGGNITKAIKQLDTAITLTPYQPQLYEKRSELYHKKGKYDESYADQNTAEQIRYIKDHGKPERKERPKKSEQPDTTTRLSCNTK